MIGSKRSPHTKLAIAIPDILGGVSSVRGFSILEKGLSSAFGLRGEGFGFETGVGVGVGADSGFSSSIGFGSSGGSGSITIPCFSQDGSVKGATRSFFGPGERRFAFCESMQPQLGTVKLSFSFPSSDTKKLLLGRIHPRSSTLCARVKVERGVSRLVRRPCRNHDFLPSRPRCTKS